MPAACAYGTVFSTERRLDAAGRMKSTQALFGERAVLYQRADGTHANLSHLSTHASGTPPAELPKERNERNGETAVVAATTT